MKAMDKLLSRMNPRVWFKQPVELPDICTIVEVVKQTLKPIILLLTPLLE